MAINGTTFPGPFVIAGVLNEELFEDPAVNVKFREVVSDKTLPPAYGQHPVVPSSERTFVLQTVIYVDAVFDLEDRQCCSYMAHQLC